MTSKSTTQSSSLAQLLQAVQAAGDGALPVEKWNPEYCGTMDMVIRKDGSWWHEGSRIGRQKLINLFAKVLRKDEDGHTYLVTPVEKIQIQVDCAPFIGVRIDVEKAGDAQTQRIFVTTNVGDVVELGPNQVLEVQTDLKTQEPTPLVHVRGRLQALINRASFYDLINYAQERETENGTELGVYSHNAFFALGEPNAHIV